MIISTAKYLEEIRKAEKRGYKKGVKECNERTCNEEMEADINKALVGLRREIRELRAKVEGASGAQKKCVRHGKCWKVLPVRIDVIKMADKKPDKKPEEPEEPEESGEAKEAQGEETEEQGENTETVTEAARQFLKKRFGKQE